MNFQDAGHISPEIKKRTPAEIPVMISFFIFDTRVGATTPRKKTQTHLQYSDGQH
jgi:hypothetical protein